MTMAALGAGRTDSYEKLMNSIKDYHATHSRSQDYYSEVSHKVGAGICEAFGAYKKGQAEKAAARLLALRGDVHYIGGSHAQRDLVSQLLLHSLLQVVQQEKREKKSIPIPGAAFPSAS